MQTQPYHSADADLTGLQQDLLRLAEAVDQAIIGATWALTHRDRSEAQHVVDRDTGIGELRSALEAHAILLLAGQPRMADDARAISSVMLIAAELERIGDHAQGIATIVLRNAELPWLSLPPAMGQMAHKAREMLQLAIRAVIRRDAGVAARLEQIDDTIDHLYQCVLRETLPAMREHPEQNEWGTYLLWIGHNFERIADRAVNIAARAAFMATGTMIPPRLEQVIAASA
jgi:phosphate transport system protein